MGEVLGWIALGVCVLLFAKIAGRLSKNQKLNQFLSKIHKPTAIFLIVLSIVHGIVSLVEKFKLDLELYTGVMILICFGLLAYSYLKRAQLKANWFKMHRYAATAMAVLLVFHIF